MPVEQPAFARCGDWSMRYTSGLTPREPWRPYVNAGERALNGMAGTLACSLFAAFRTLVRASATQGENTWKPRRVNLDATAFEVSRSARPCVGAGAEETLAAARPAVTGRRLA